MVLLLLASGMLGTASSATAAQSIQSRLVSMEGTSSMQDTIPAGVKTFNQQTNAMQTTGNTLSGNTIIDMLISAAVIALLVLLVKRTKPKGRYAEGIESHFIRSMLG